MAAKERLRVPDFFGIGAQKAGTTWLYANLRRHPELWLPPVKELHYFDEIHIPEHRRWTQEQRLQRCDTLIAKYRSKQGEDKRNSRYLKRIAAIASLAEGDDAYCRVFGSVPARRLCGEITPEYAILPDDGISHLMQLAPRSRIILSLRDPIERSWSHARMMADRNGKNSAEDLMRLALGREASVRSDYPTVIERWLHYVDRDSLLILFMDDIVARPSSVLKRVCEHLGVGFEEKHFPKLGELVHAGKPMSIPETIHAAMRQQQRPIYERIAALFPEVGARWMATHYS